MKRLDELAQTKLRVLTADPSVILAPYRVHDFRMTCEPRLAQLGFNRDIRDAIGARGMATLRKPAGTEASAAVETGLYLGRRRRQATSANCPSLICTSKLSSS